MIRFQKEKCTDAQIFALLNPLMREWFQAKFGAFTEPQRYAIPNIHNSLNTLVSAETGTGKTLAGFTAILNELITLSEYSQLEDRVYCVYISPLRALSNDIERNLNEPLNEITALAKKQGKKISVRVSVRTGDTSTGERSKMLRKPPHILITTPESLAILLNAPKFRDNLRNVKWLIVDEVHALAENKRGVHLSLSLERLQRLSPEMCRIGLSATVSPLRDVAEFLVGMKNTKETRDCRIVDVSFMKKMDLKVISPLKSFTDVTPEQTHESLYTMLDNLIQSHRTTLIFTNTRAATERVVHYMKDKFPKKYNDANIGAHHSSLSRGMRLNVEERLKRGELKCVVCSTSLELGIDIGYIDLVVLLSSPKSVARAIQRMGRSGHMLHSTVKGRLVVMDRDDLVECAVLLKNAVDKKIDKLQIPKNCLDVLAQHIYGIAIADKIHIDDLFKLVRGSYNYRELSRYDFNEVIAYLSGEYAALEVRHVYAKIWHDKETGEVGRRGKMARIIYMTNIGTIPDESRVKVKIKDLQLGTIDEAFLERLKPGDVFVLGGQTYEFRFTRGMTAQVKTASQRPPTVPSWVSEMLPLSFDLAVEIQNFRKLMEEKFRAKRTKKEIIDFLHSYLHVDNRAANAIYEYFSEQFRFSKIPHRGRLLIEQYREGDTTHLIFHSLFGRRTNDALSRAYAFALSKMMHRDIEMTMNDNGFVLSSSHKMPLDKAFTAVKSSELRKVIEMAIDRTEVLSRRFRHCAVRALMILRNYRGKNKSAGRQQMSSRLLLLAVKRIDENFSILKEARREVMEDLMDIRHAEMVIEAIEKGLLKVEKVQTPLPSPFALGIFMAGRADIMKMEDRLEFVRRMHAEVMKRIN
ncbi:ATP-dependent helicase [Candidatus Micrarchaeota archaeon]|nr:ATP-dependent helicase [Candidatus Micrarchaeota archaeon]